jgi:subtilase family serine protease
MNQGNGSSGASTIFHLPSDAVYGGTDDVVLTGIRNLGSLAASASSAATTNLTVPSTTNTGTYYLCARVDSGAVVAESNENNNSRCYAETIQVRR